MFICTPFINKEYDQCFRAMGLFKIQFPCVKSLLLLIKSELIWLNTLDWYRLQPFGTKWKKELPEKVQFFTYSVRFLGKNPKFPCVPRGITISMNYLCPVAPFEPSFQEIPSLRLHSEMSVAVWNYFSARVMPRVPEWPFGWVNRIRTSYYEVDFFASKIRY